MMYSFIHVTNEIINWKVSYHLTLNLKLWCKSLFYNYYSFNKKKCIFLFLIIYWNLLKIKYRILFVKIQIYSLILRKELHGYIKKMRESWMYEKKDRKLSLRIKIGI